MQSAQLSAGRPLHMLSYGGVHYLSVNLTYSSPLFAPTNASRRQLAARVARIVLCGLARSVSGEPVDAFVAHSEWRPARPPPNQTARAQVRGALWRSGRIVGPATRTACSRARAATSNQLAGSNFYWPENSPSNSRLRFISIDFCDSRALGMRSWLGRSGDCTANTPQQARQQCHIH